MLTHTQFLKGQRVLVESDDVPAMSGTLLTQTLVDGEREWHVRLDEGGIVSAYEDEIYLESASR